jgi:hypothetical protein
MASISGIHLDTVFFEDNDEYGEFLFLAKSIQGSSNIESNSEGNAS